MYAQVTTVEASPARFDSATHFFREQILPQLQQMDGFKGFVALGDRQRGKLLGVALWESEEVAQSAEEVMSRLRGGIPHPPGGAAVDVENYEVFILEVAS
jgi:hypothetical protein